MTIPEVVRCPDGHFRRAIYGLGPYIADYPEQALLACIVQGWCAKYVIQNFTFLINLAYNLDVLHRQIILTSNLRAVPENIAI